MKSISKLSSQCLSLSALFCFSMLFLFVDSHRVYAQAAATPAEFSDLTLQISTSKMKFVEYDPIPLILKLRNDTNSPITGHSALNLTSNLVSLRIRRDGESEKVFHGFSPVAKSISVRAKTIAAGEEYEAKEILNFRLDELFPERGRYQIQAILLNHNGTKRVLSNTIAVEFTAARDIDRQALDFIKRNSNSKLFLAGGKISQGQTLRDMENFAEDFGSSIYAEYVAFNLGEYYFFKKEYPKAANQLQKLINKTDFHYAEKVKNYLSKIQIGGDSED